MKLNKRVLSPWPVLCSMVGGGFMTGFYFGLYYLVGILIFTACAKTGFNSAAVSSDGVKAGQAVSRENQKSRGLAGAIRVQSPYSDKDLKDKIEFQIENPSGEKSKPKITEDLFMKGVANSDYIKKRISNCDDSPGDPLMLAKELRASEICLSGEIDASKINEIDTNQLTLKNVKWLTTDEEKTGSVSIYAKELTLEGDNLIQSKAILTHSKTPMGRGLVLSFSHLNGAGRLRLVTQGRSNDRIQLR